MQVASALLLALTALSAAPAHAISSEAVASMAASKLPGEMHCGNVAHGRNAAGLED